MFIPPKPISKKELEELNNKILELGEKGLYKLMLDKGWCEESAKSISEAIWILTINEKKINFKTWLINLLYGE